MEEQQILIVDDEAVNREILKSMFEEYDRLEAENGREAIAKIAEPQSGAYLIGRFDACDDGV